MSPQSFQNLEDWFTLVKQTFKDRPMPLVVRLRLRSFSLPPLIFCPLPSQLFLTMAFADTCVPLNPRLDPLYASL